MPDWIGGAGEPTATRYRTLAERNLHGVSPSYERICLGVADDADLLRRLDELPAPKRQPNLLLAAVRFLGGPVSSWPEFRDFAAAEWDAIADCMRSRRTQTNEPGRCTAFLPVLSTLPQPLALFEVGASAGLCLYPDRYRYRYGARTLGTAGPELRCEIDGAVPVPTELPQIAWRGGLDLHPLDVADNVDVRWLESLIWPEQTRRFEVLRSAVEVARTDPPSIVTGDLSTDLLAAAAAVPDAGTLVVFHSAVLAYLESAGRAAFIEQVHALAATRRVCWLANESPGVIEGTEVFRDRRAEFVLTHDGRPIALTGPHGQSLEWLD